MQSKSHGRRWKFRIEPLRRKIASGWNPFHDSDSNSGSDNENEIVPENRNKVSHMCDGLYMYACAHGICVVCMWCVHVCVCMYVCAHMCVHVCV